MPDEIPREARAELRQKLSDAFYEHDKTVIEKVVDDRLKRERAVSILRANSDEYAEVALTAALPFLREREEALRAERDQAVAALVESGWTTLRAYDFYRQTGARWLWETFYWADALTVPQDEESR
jgi:uncharacterized membrane protein